MTHRSNALQRKGGLMASLPIVLPLMLAACGGADGPTEASAKTVNGIARPALVAGRERPQAATAPQVIDATALFDWAQWKYPSLFPSGPQNFPLLYLGVNYTIRAYPNGNHLGLTEGGLVFGLGPFTYNVLTGFGALADYAAPVTADACSVYPNRCLPPPSNATLIAAGLGFSLAVNAKGEVYSWGDDSAVQLGDGQPNAGRNTAKSLATPNAVRSVDAGNNHSVAVRSDGTVWAWGWRDSIDCLLGQFVPSPVQIGGAANIVAAIAGGRHTLLLRNDGVVLALGCNDAGQLGRPGAAPAATAVPVVGLPLVTAIAVGTTMSLALDANGNVWSWGVGASGDGTSLTTSRSTPTQIAGLAGITAIAAGYRHALALTHAGSLLAWGQNLYGEIGDGTTIERDTPAPTLLTSGITAIAAGWNISLALRTDGTLLSWGINDSGQLGSGQSTPEFRTLPNPVVGLGNVTAIAARGRGRGHALALRSDGTVWAWGANGVGQLGNGTATSSNIPVQVTGLNLK